MPITWVDMFLTARPEAVAGEALEQALAASVAAGAAAWPDVTVSTARFVRAIAARAGDAAAIAALEAGDLYVVCGCVKRRYRAEFKQAFQRAVDELESRDRLVLRQHTLDGLGIDQLAALHRVHRATAARWVTSAREAVRSATQRALTDRLQLAPDELDSLIRLIRSELDVSLPRLLAKPPEW